MIGATIDQVSLYAEGLRQMCAAREISHKGTCIHVTVSIGIAGSRGGADLAKVMRSADNALYAAKRRGRNCVVQTEADAFAAGTRRRDFRAAAAAAGRRHAASCAG